MPEMEKDTLQCLKPRAREAPVLRGHHRGQNLDKTREGHSVSGLLFWQENIEVPRDMRRDDPHSVGKVMRDLLAAGWLRVERTTRVEAAGGTRCEVALS